MSVGSVGGASSGSVGGASSAGHAQAAHKSATPLHKIKLPDNSNDSVAATATQVASTAHKPSVSPLANSSHAVQAAVSGLNPGGTSSA